MPFDNDGRKHLLLLGEQKAAKLAFGVQPADVPEYTEFAASPTVEAQTAGGQVDTSFSGNITVAILNNPGSGEMVGTLTEAAVEGVATFDDLRFNEPGTGYTIRATSTGKTAGDSDAFNVTVLKLVITVQPTATDKDATISTVTVQAQNADNELVTGFTEEVTIAIDNNPGTGTLDATSIKAAVGGIVEFDDMTIDEPGTGYTLKVTATDVTEDTSDAFNILDFHDRIYLSPWMRDSVGQGTWVIYDSVAAVQRAEYWNQSDVDGDNISFEDYFTAGTYTCKMLYRKATGGGIVKIKIAGNTEMTVDTYDAGGPVYNQIATQTGIVVSASGLKTIQLVVDGKNASSAGHLCLFTEIVFYRTA